MVARKTITANAHLNSSEIAREHQMLAVQGFGSLIRTPSTAPEYAGPRRLDLEKSRAITRALTVKVLPVRRFCNAFAIPPDYGIRKLTYSQVWTQVADICSKFHQTACRFPNRGQQSDRELRLLHNDSHRLIQVGVVGDNRGVLEDARQGISHQVGPEINVGALFFCLDYANKVGGRMRSSAWWPEFHRLNHEHPLIRHLEIAQMYVQIWQSF